MLSTRMLEDNDNPKFYPSKQKQKKILMKLL